MNTPTEALLEALRECLTPEAIALIVANLESADCRHVGARGEVRWFLRALTAELGGPAAVGKLYAEIGV